MFPISLFNGLRKALILFAIVLQLGVQFRQPTILLLNFVINGMDFRFEFTFLPGASNSLGGNVLSRSDDPISVENQPIQSDDFLAVLKFR